MVVNIIETRSIYFFPKNSWVRSDSEVVRDGRFMEEDHGASWEIILHLLQESPEKILELFGRSGVAQGQSHARRRYEQEFCPKRPENKRNVA